MNVSGIANETFVGARCIAAAHLVCSSKQLTRIAVQFTRPTGRQHTFLSTSSRSLAYAYKAKETLRERVGLPREILKRGISVCTQKRGIPDPLRELLSELDGVDEFSVTGVLETRNPDIAGLTLAKYFKLAPPREALIKAFEVELEQLVHEFGCLAGVDHASVTACVTRVTTCSKLHVDNVGLRLLCTYRGPGTEWVASPFWSHLTAESVKNGGNALTDALKEVVTAVAPIQRAEEGEVVILKGQAFPDNRGGAIVHRSPSLTAGVVRLLVKIDDSCCGDS